MSRFTQSRTARFVAGSLLTVVAVAGPLATGHAQSVSPERAFLNSASVTDRVVIDSKLTAPTIDGNRALLGRSSPDDSTTLVLATRSGGRSNIVTGEQAFLGRVQASNRRRVILAW
jgi:hypothetical protein